MLFLVGDVLDECIDMRWASGRECERDLRRRRPSMTASLDYRRCPSDRRACVHEMRCRSKMVDGSSWKTRCEHKSGQAIATLLVSFHKADWNFPTAKRLNSKAQGRRAAAHPGK